MAFPRANNYWRSPYRQPCTNCPVQVVYHFSGHQAKMSRMNPHSSRPLVGGAHGVSWKNIAQENYKLSGHRLDFLHGHLATCNAVDELITQNIYLARCLKSPSTYQGLPGLHIVRFVCRQQADAIRHALSPIERVPDDILIEIFTLCLPHNHHFSRNLAPLLMCGVSKSWCALAKSNRGLWKKMSFWSPPASKRDQGCYPTRLVNMWLNRSKPSPLELFFEVGMSQNHVKTYADLVLEEHGDRCQHLQLSVSTASAIGLINIITSRANPFKLLESLVLEGLDTRFACDDGDEDDGEEEYPITAFQSLPRLRKLAISSLDFTYRVRGSVAEFNASVLPWAQLTHMLITEFVDVDVFIRALAKCPAIQFLRVSLSLALEDGEPVNADFIDVPINVSLPTLTNMYISVDGGTAFPHAMNIFHLPALTAFHFRRFPDNPDEPDQFSWAKSAHFCDQLEQLQELRLTGCVGSTEAVILLLRCTTALTKLMLDIYTDYQALIPALFPSDTTSPLRCLTALELHLQSHEMPLPQGPSIQKVVDIVRTGFGFFQRRLLDVAAESLQPSTFRFREMVESTQPRLLSHLTVVKLVPPRKAATSCDRVLHELRNQFKTSLLTTSFEEKVFSSRIKSDRDLLQTSSFNTFYTLG